MVIRKWFSHPVIVTGIAINLFVLLLALAWSGPQHAAQLSRLLVEDGIVEWMQFLSFAMTSGLLLFAACERWQRSKFDFVVFALLGMGAVVALAAMEEISWFQRILHVQSPEFFAQNNRQAETNLHNLAIGSKGSIHKTILLKLIVLAGLTHNLVLPLLARWRPAVRSWVEKLGVYLPPLWAAVVYLVLVILSHVLTDHERKGELGEMFGAVHYMATIFSAYFLGQNYGQPAVFENPADTRRVAKLFSILMLFLLMTAWLLSAGAGAMDAVQG
ncbi:hypothetical protein [Massilia endophytica]|uniref:hypothetical protein n=1 Tax=Massilia endophytica TaxID=2899220 RepID=UPI001E56D77A|nr:hypothetical protein [Massilia endophytica]UGQ48756.1 hypothetical protein LSQ66_09930 [Massilia endophytica]